MNFESMILYEATADKFIKDVFSNQIISEIEKCFEEKLGRKIPPSEISAYQNSLPRMGMVLSQSGIAGDCGVLVEYKIPLTNFRIDFVISGTDVAGKKNFVIVELKQWQKAKVADGDGIVETFVGQNNRLVTHPSYQALRYKDFMGDFNEVIFTGLVKAYSCAYLHNYAKNDPEPLLDSRYRQIIEESPVYFRDDQEMLQEFLSRYVKYGKGKDILYEISESKIRPSKKLIDHVASMFEGNSSFILLDEQKVVFETSRLIANKREKTVVIVKGGPGTGKSVVSVNLIAKLLEDGLNAIFVAPNSSFRNSIVKKLVQHQPVQRIKNLFKGSAAFFDARPNEFDVLIVDEAHRLKGKGAYMYKGVSQVEDVIDAAKVSIFFIDDNQVVRPEDIGTVSALKATAAAKGIDVVELELHAQFRCAGAEGYVNWLDDVLNIKETANYDGWDGATFDFRIFDDPNKLRSAIEEKAEAGNSARILAGYAWEWTPADKGNRDAQVSDVCIPEFNFEMPWNSRKVGATWAIDSDGIGQVGCIHTTQGLEFDYVGVIVGADLAYDKNTSLFITDYKKYKDKLGKRGMKDSGNELNKFVRNIYKVLMSRGQRGCYVYFCDEDTKEYFMERLKRNS